MPDTLTPTQIVEKLDKYIIGQTEAKKSLAIALRSRWRRMHTDPIIREEIMPNNIMIIGPTGTGKTECARRLAKIANVPFVKQEITKFTEQGYVGREVDSMVRDLADQTFSMIKKKRKRAVLKEASKIVEDIILDALIPPVSKQETTSNTATLSTDQDKELNEQTRLRFREKIRNGTLDHRKIEINIEQRTSLGIGFMSNGMMDNKFTMNFEKILEKMAPKNIKKRKLTIAQAKKILLEQQKNKLIDIENIKEETLQKTQQDGIIFIDEIDKIASNTQGSNSPNISREGVQRDLLPIVEGCTVNTKYGPVNTDHILFIAAGAFHQSSPSDLMPELQGRFPIRVELKSLTKQDFYHILKEPQNSLIKQYQALFAAEKVTLNFSQDAIKEIAYQTFTFNKKMEDIGARRLQTVLSYLLNDFLFKVPDKIKQGEKIDITKELVIGRLDKLTKEKDINQKMGFLF